MDRQARDREDTGIADYAREHTSQAAKALTDTTERVTAAAGTAIDYAKSTMAEIREHGWSNILEDVTQFTRTRPLPALAIAAGLGLLVGRLTARPSGEASGQPLSVSGVHWPPRMESAS